MPPCSPVSRTVADQSSSALHTLVLNLRAHEPDATAVHRASLSDADDAALVGELQERVDRLVDSDTLSQHDRALAQTLISLIAHFHRLAALYPRTSVPTSPRVASWNPHTVSPSLSAVHDGPSDPFVHFRRQLSDFQLSRGEGVAMPAVSPVELVETTLLWARVDEELEHVLNLCRARTTEDPQILDTELLPPEYDAAGYDDELDFTIESEGLPEYEVGQWSALDAKTASPSSKANEPETSSPVLGGAGGLSEKMRLDLDAVTLAIDRLYLVAPQLHNQRVELKKAKVEQMERARLEGLSLKRARVREGKQRAVDTTDSQDLERMLELIGRASQRKLVNQAVALEDGLKAKLENARQRDLEKRDAFVAQLVHHSAVGRLHSQDAVFPTSNGRRKEKDPEALLSLPEFMREAVPEPSRLRMQMADSHALLSLPEFMKEPTHSALEPLTPPPCNKSSKGYRSRSLSAPPLSWLLASSSRPSSPGQLSESKRTKAAGKMRRVGSSVSRMPALQTGLDVHYVAEYHESLQHILIFLTVYGSEPDVPLEAEVVPLSDVPGFERECLCLRSGASTSPYLSLPARVHPGKKEVQEIGGHYQIKLAAAPSTPTGTPTSSAYPSMHAALLDADQLSELTPTGFVCASCSLPLVHCSQVSKFKDLPSEHWAELVDAWMCHSDQKLHENVTRHSNEGFWPTKGLAFVGGSYILFDESAVVKSNFWPSSQETKSTDDWQRVHCICGAVIGRCQDHQPKDAPCSIVYRLAKYAVRPTNPAAEPARVPLSAFIAEDMNEFVQAHATYRFVILDEEDERPRILMWLFKPNMRLAYITPAQYVIPKSGSIHAAKVLYKVLKPSIAFSDLPALTNKYPGFPQAEHLYYPIDICRRLGNLLKESTTAYPESLRTMTGLSVGWLQRA
ncbi:HECT-like ubiquitin-conjugating enzyme-binding-domain-containing protein [Sparassis latifolia]